MKKTSQTILALTLLLSGMLPFAWRSEVSFANPESMISNVSMSFPPSEPPLHLSFREKGGISSRNNKRGESQAFEDSFAHPACPLLPDSTACEAELLAMEVSGEMFPPAALYDQIYDDLTAIRQAYPKMNEIVHAPRWMPGELLVGFTEEAWQKVQNGNYDGFDELNSQYGAVEISTPYASIPYAYLRFEQRHHPEPLASLYAQAEGVTSAEPNWAISDGTQIEVSHREYRFVLGWGDCSSGCMYHRYWDFTVNESGVTLTREFGDPLQQSTQLYFPIIQVP